MLLRPPGSKRTATLFPYPTLFRSLFELEGPPDRIEVYDNSHIMGTNMVGAMIVAGPEGFRKNQYRKFNIKRPETTAGDDFAMLRSEEHTSELQSLMRNSYAVFCLKKQITLKIYIKYTTHHTT